MVSASGNQQLKLERRLELYQSVLNNIPVPAIEQRGPFYVREQVEAIMPLPLAFRKQKDRIEFWRDQWSLNQLASQFSTFQSIVDVQRLSSDNINIDYYSMLGDRFAIGADELYQLATGPQDTITVIKSYMAAADIRTSSLTKDMDRTTDAYECIRDIRFRQGYN
ncbi:hypothetical protein IQ07DRAFT_648691 [Pyrenochaeta sp. DS3sAY3a]|nr:hypothetical protein IQ07DRAFT_648691 [Pyrenochaeta sp. DS3sAY3a]